MKIFALRLNMKVPDTALFLTDNLRYNLHILRKYRK